jgi:DeoR/GlpR family transcriptional regulator of sugar metabolism
MIEMINKLEIIGDMAKKPFTPVQRQAEIRRLLLTQEEASIEDLCQRLSTSPATIRRDLDLLETEAPIERTHGGARIRPIRQAEQNFAARESQDIPEKQAIAAAVMKIITPRSTIFLNDGSTIMAISKAILAAGIEVFVATPAVNVATKLSEGSGVTSCLLGGIVRQTSLATAGPFTDTMASQINADLAIISPDGIHADAGATFIHPQDAALARRMSDRSEKTIVVATASKLQRRERITAIGLSAIHTLVTCASADRIAEIERAGLNVVSAPIAGKDGYD